MLIEEYGKEFEFDGRKLIIGEAVLGTKQSAYEGIAGILMEVRTDKDKTTDSEMPELYCAFHNPVLSENRKDSPATDYNSELKITIVSPYDVFSLAELKKSNLKKTVFYLTEDWAYNGKSGNSSEIYTNMEDAKKVFEMLMCEETTYYGISYFSGRKGYAIEITDNSVKAFVEGEYAESHYELKIEKKDIYISPDFLISES